MIMLKIISRNMPKQGELSDGACDIAYQDGWDTMTIDTFVTIDTCEVPCKIFRKICTKTPAGVSFTFGHFVINNNSLQLDDTIYCDNLDMVSTLGHGDNTAAEAAWDNFRKLGIN